MSHVCGKNGNEQFIAHTQARECHGQGKKEQMQMHACKPYSTNYKINIKILKWKAETCKHTFSQMNVYIPAESIPKQNSLSARSVRNEANTIHFSTRFFLIDHRENEGMGSLTSVMWPGQICSSMSFGIQMCKNTKHKHSLDLV